MEFRRFLTFSPKPSNIILLALSIHLSVGVVTHSLWLLRGNQTLFRYYFGYEDPLFLLIAAMAEFSLARLAWKQFSPGQSLRWAWFLIMISASCHVVGSVLTQILARDSYINPLYDINPLRVRSAYPALSTVGSFIGGPLQMLTLAGGLFLALRLCRKLGIGRQRTIDWVILAIVVAYTFRVLYVVIWMEIGANRPTHQVDVLTWGNDPLLCVLLFFAFFLRRSVAEMGWGYVTRCWTAYVVAILGTSVASMAIWAADFNILPYPERAVIWYIWPIIFAAYALGPAYQVEAVRLAKARLEDSHSDPWDTI